MHERLSIFLAEDSRAVEGASPPHCTGGLTACSSPLEQQLTTGASTPGRAATAFIPELHRPRAAIFNFDQFTPGTTTKLIL